ncbi:MAG: hypothetical protein KJ062_22600 [Thermoanaerobaculia bacterium]|nr:hypothetical protein [Thermoanaerobaculia bacterium]
MSRRSPLLLLSALLLSTGCASLVYPSHDDVQVVTDPPGATATCGGARVVTPGTLRISRRKTDSVVVRVEKEGYEPREIVIARNHLLPMKPWSFGLGVIAVSALAADGCESIAWPECQEATLVTALAAAVVTGAGIAIDSASPRTYALPRHEIVLRLDPVRLAEAQQGEPR